MAPIIDCTYNTVVSGFEINKKIQKQCLTRLISRLASSRSFFLTVSAWCLDQAGYGSGGAHFWEGDKLIFLLVILFGEGAVLER